jgi:hypothetical protein
MTTPMPLPELLAALRETGDWTSSRHDRLSETEALTLLTEQIAVRRREERERCAKVAERFLVTPEVAAAIRALPDLPTTEPDAPDAGVLAELNGERTDELKALEVLEVQAAELASLRAQLAEAKAENGKMTIAHNKVANWLHEAGATIAANAKRITELEAGLRHLVDGAMEDIDGLHHVHTYKIRRARALLSTTKKEHPNEPK